MLPSPSPSQVHLARLREQEERVLRQREAQRRHRTAALGPLPHVAVVGYTNVGKSSLVARLARDDRVQPEHALFSTLDTITRLAWVGPSSELVTVSDTVGFIQVRRACGLERDRARYTAVQHAGSESV